MNDKADTPNPSSHDSLTEAAAARLRMRRNEWAGMTVHKLPGWVQCNLVVLPADDAAEFRAFCTLNPQACPVIDFTDPGDPEPRIAAPGADLRTDLARYAVYEHGRLIDEPTDILDRWRDDSVAFLIGSSLAFDALFEEAGIPRSDVWVLRTQVQTKRTPRFAGRLLVTMRLMSREYAEKAAAITARYPKLHGGPVHIGDPAAIGADLAQPLNGEPLAVIPHDRVPVFWACGVTPQQIAIESKLPSLISHCSGYGFITDLTPDDL